MDSQSKWWERGIPVWWWLKQNYLLISSHSVGEGTENSSSQISRRGASFSWNGEHLPWGCTKFSVLNSMRSILDCHSFTKVTCNSRIQIVCQYMFSVSKTSTYILIYCGHFVAAIFGTKYFNSKCLMRERRRQLNFSCKLLMCLNARLLQADRNQNFVICLTMVMRVHLCALVFKPDWLHLWLHLIWMAKSSYVVADIREKKNLRCIFQCKFCEQSVVSTWLWCHPILLA